MKAHLKRVAKAVLGLLVAGCSTAHALPTLRLTDVGSATVVTVVDGSDSNPMAGAVAFSGPVGIWTVASSLGVTHPFPTYTTANDRMGLNAMFSSSGAGDFLLQWSDTDFNSIAGVATFLATIGGTLSSAVPGATLDYEVWAGADNSLFSHTGGMITDVSIVGGGAFTGMDTGTFGPSGTFSLTIEVLVHHAGAGTSSFNADEQNIPEGGTTGPLLGAAILAFVALAARRRFVA